MSEQKHVSDIKFARHRLHQDIAELPAPQAYAITHRAELPADVKKALKKVAGGWQGYQTEDGELAAFIFFPNPGGIILAHKTACAIRVCQLTYVLKQNKRLISPIYTQVRNTKGEKGYAVIIPGINQIPKGVFDQLLYYYKRSFMYAGIGEDLYVRIITADKQTQFPISLHEVKQVEGRVGDRSANPAQPDSILTQESAVRPNEQKTFAADEEILIKTDIILEQFLIENNVNYVKGGTISVAEKEFLTKGLNEHLTNVMKQAPPGYQPLFVNASTEFLTPVIQHCKTIAMSEIEDVSLARLQDKFFAKKDLSENQYKYLKENPWWLEGSNLIVDENQGAYRVFIPLVSGCPDLLIKMTNLISPENLGIQKLLQEEGFSSEKAEVDKPKLLFDIRKSASITEQKPQRSQGLKLTEAYANLNFLGEATTAQRVTKETTDPRVDNLDSILKSTRIASK